jgi:putative tryptophan/tyrosine transport system substrate-binding protein
MKRREFITLLGGATAWPFAARSQQSTKMKRMGTLMAFTENDPEGQARMAVFRSQLEKVGWAEGHNIRIEYRWGAPNSETMRRLAKELVGLDLDCIFTHTTVSSVAMQEETKDIPIIFVQVSDPVGSGLVASLSRPERNATGFTETGADTMTGKWLGLLKEIAPHVTRVIALTSDPGASSYFVRSFVEAALPVGVEALVIRVEKPSDFEPLFAAQASEPLTGLLVTPDSFLTFHRAAITSLAARYRLPAVYPFRYFTKIGGLLSYGSDPLDIMRRAAGYADRILRGEKPSELAVQNPVKFDLVVNVKAAKELGIDVPLSLLGRADEVIE